MIDRIPVSLDIKNQSVREACEKVIASQQEFYLSSNGTSQNSHLLILEMDDDPNQTFARINTILAEAPSPEVFLTAPRTEPEILLEALRAGVKEFVPQPIKPEELKDALARFKERHRERKPAAVQRGKLITVIGSKGGVGTTTVAVNLATSIRQVNDNSSVVLVDLNPQFGDAALFLDMEPAHTMGDVAKNIARLDETFLMSVLSKHSSGLYLLPSVHAVEDIGLLTPDAVAKTLELLQTRFDYIIIDSGDSLADTTLATLNLSTTVFLVCTLTLPVLRNTKRLLDILTYLNYPIDHIKIIINRYEKHTEVSIKDMEEVLGRSASWMIPNDYFTTMNAINKGQPLLAVASRADVTKSFKRFAQALSTEEQQDHKGSFLSRLFKSH